jgi:hypothetical protein
MRPRRTHTGVRSKTSGAVASTPADNPLTRNGAATTHPESASSSIGRRHLTTKGIRVKYTYPLWHRFLILQP